MLSFLGVAVRPVCPSRSLVWRVSARHKADDAGISTILLTTVKLKANTTYWVAVQANGDLEPFGQWGWATSTTSVGKGDIWRNPGNGFENDWGEPTVTELEEADDVVRIAVRATTGGLSGDDCEDSLEVRLSAPLGDRALIDGSNEQTVEVRRF